MAKNEDSGSPGWSASLLLQPMDDVARPVEAAAAAATTVPSTRPSVLFSSKDDINDSPLKKLQNQVSRVLKGFSHSPEDHRPLKEPSRIFESMVFVGLHPNCDIQALQKAVLRSKV
ncbi:DENN (AEX-3) domain-containing protein [Actinidia rufa]|uniref:DENN (AEX-3) domain-containing protein n=1 Tax=Actinidia rufa TaxID=165716 RepID=A0A7J0GJ45_9ERIC|nr:DENN (AEX-3) domain-containing protein [Actinidia rufa]